MQNLVKVQNRIENANNKCDMWKIANNNVKLKQNNIMMLEEKGKKIEDESAIAVISINNLNDDIFEKRRLEMLILKHAPKMFCSFNRFWVATSDHPLEWKELKNSSNDAFFMIYIVHLQRCTFCISFIQKSPYFFLSCHEADKLIVCVFLSPLYYIFHYSP